MTLAEAEKRLAGALKVITGWEAAPPTGKVKDNMRMVFQETQVLYAIEQKHPTLAEQARALGRRFGDLALRLKSEMH